MRSHPSSRQPPIAFATACALVLMLAAGPAAAQAPEEPIDLGPTPPEINNPTGDEPTEVTVIDSDEIGDSHPSGSEDTETLSAPSDDDDLSTSSSGSSTDSVASGSAVTSVRDVPLARTGFPVLALAALGGLSLVTGLCLLRLRLA